jgi:hypothetical protein
LVERQRRRAAWGRRSRSEARRPALFSFSRPGGGESDSYAELRTVWTRPWPDDPQADRRAWEVALRDGADPAVILAAARAWVAAIEPRFLPVLAKWLGACGWQKPPPAKRSRGNGSRRGKGKADLSRLALLAGGYEEDPDGELFWPGGSVQ